MITKPPSLDEMEIPEFSTQIFISKTSNPEEAYTNDIKETQKINLNMGKGVNTGVAILTDVESEFLFQLGENPKEYISIKSRGRIDDGHTSRISAVHNHKFFIKFLPEVYGTQLDLNFEKEVKLSKYLNSMFAKHAIQFKMGSYDLTTPKVLEYIDNKYIKYDYIQNENNLTIPDILKIYHHLNLLTLIPDLEIVPRFNFENWLESFNQIVIDLNKSGLITIDSEELIRLIQSTNNTFNATEGYVHGDVKIDDHILVKGNTIFVVDNERNKYTSILFDAATFNIRLLREGYGYLYLNTINTYKINNSELLKLLIILEIYLILREYGAVFLNPNILNSSIHKIGVKKHRDFTILLKKVAINFKLLGMQFKYEDIDIVFNKFEINYE